jgi:hypothetical protein
MIRGISPMESHHPEMRVNSPETVSIPANLHADLTAKQLKWPDSLKAYSDDSLIQIARRYRVMMDYLECLRNVIDIDFLLDYIEYLLNACERDSNFLLGLSLDQQELNGPDWCKQGGVAPLVPSVPALSVSKVPDEN